MIGRNDRRQKRGGGCGGECQKDRRGACGNYRIKDSVAWPPRFGRVHPFAVFQRRVSDDEKRQARVPEHIEPGHRLRAAAEKTRGCKNTGKRQFMGDGQKTRKQEPAGQNVMIARTGGTEVAEKENRGDQVIGGDDRLIAWYESPDRGKRDAGERRRREED